MSTPTRRLAIPARVAALVIVLLFAAACTGGDAASGTEGAGDAEAVPEDVAQVEAVKGPVSVRVTARPKAPTLSDELDVAVTITRDTNVEVEPPPVRISLGEFVVRDVRHDLPDVKDGREVQTTHYRLEPQRTGAHLIRPIVVKFSVPEDAGGEGAGKSFTVRTEPLRIDVGTTLGDAAPKLADLRGARDLVPVARPPLQVRWWWFAVGGGALVALGLVVYVVMRRRRRPAPEKKHTPEELAYLEMQALIQQDYVAQHEYGTFYVELTGIVRRYVERTTGVHAPELTTEEFLREMKARELFDAERQGRLGSFLEAADLIKFAAQVPDAEDIERSFDTAKAFVGLGQTERAA